MEQYGNHWFLGQWVTHKQLVLTGRGADQPGHLEYLTHLDAVLLDCIIGTTPTNFIIFIVFSRSTADFSRSHMMRYTICYTVGHWCHMLQSLQYLWNFRASRQDLGIAWWALEPGATDANWIPGTCCFSWHSKYLEINVKSHERMHSRRWCIRNTKEPGETTAVVEWNKSVCWPLLCCAQPLSHKDWHVLTPDRLETVPIIA